MKDAAKKKRMETIDLTRLYRKYKGQWVALNEYTPKYRVVSNGRKPTAVYKKAVAKGCEKPVLLKVSTQLQNAMI